MRIRLAGSAMGGPTGMADAAGAAIVKGRESLFQLCHLAHAMDQGQAAILLHRNARRVIAAVFQALQTLDQAGLDGICAGIAYDSAHRETFRLNANRRETTHCRVETRIRYSKG